jgi:sarcosine/dimethylglycine N-methyltransferase
MATSGTHYAVRDIETRILGALRTAGLDPAQRLAPEQLAGLDHFHTGGLGASRVLQELAQVRAEDRVLDLGAGLAGPARMLAAAIGCRVDCIEPSADYRAGAALLNRLTGLGDVVVLHEGSALQLPFLDASFDVAWMQNVGMNIEDKQKLYREVRRVLKTGGRFAFQEMIAGTTSASYFPLPWATDATENFLIPADAMRSLLGECGFAADYFEDVSTMPAGGGASAPAPAPPQVPLSLSTYVDELVLKAENAARSLREGQIRFFRGVFRAR